MEPNDAVQHEAATQPDLRAAGERALQRLAERRSLADPETAAARELRATLGRAETQIEAIREATSELRAVLPTRVEAAVARALAGHEGASLARRVDETRDLAGDAAAGIRALHGELQLERVARLEDLEVMVELIAGGVGATRGDIAAAAARVGAIEARLDATDDRLVRLDAQLAEVSAALEAIAPLLGKVAAAAERPLRFTLDRDGI